MTPSLEPEIEQLAHHYARQHDLPDWLVVAIIMQESGGNPWAMHFDQTFLERGVPIAPERFEHTASMATERIALATRWGLMRLRGLTARARGFQEPFLSALCDPETGLEYGCRHLAHLRESYLKDLSDWQPVIAAYDTGSPRKNEDGKWVNAEYVAGVLNKGGMA